MAPSQYEIEYYPNEIRNKDRYQCPQYAAHAPLGRILVDPNSDEDRDDQPLVVVFEPFDQQDAFSVLLDQVLNPDAGKGYKGGLDS